MRKNEKTFKEALSDFTNDTALHGVKYIRHSPNITSRCVWLLLFLGMTGLFIYQIDDRIEHYFSRPVTVDITVDDNRGQIPFPAVTICNTNTYRLSDTYADGTYEAIVDFYNQNGTWGSQNNETSTADHEKTPIDDIDMRTLILKYGHRLNETVKLAKFQSDYISTANLTSVLTDYGQCLGFNHDDRNVIYSQGTGAAFGLKLLINLENYQKMEGEHDSAGLEILVHNKRQAIRVADLALSVPPSMTAIIDIRAKQTTELQEPYGKCVKGAQTQSMCQYHCYIRVTSSICNCLPFYAEKNPRNLKYCTLKQHRDCYKKHQAKIRQNPKICGVDECPPPCQQLTYDSRISYTSLSEYVARKMLLKEKRDQNMVDDYKKARETQHKTDPSIAAEDYKSVHHFIIRFRKLRNVIQELATFYKNKDVRVVNDYITVFDKLYSYHDWQQLMITKYLEITNVDKIDGLIFPGLRNFKTALEVTLQADSQIVNASILNNSFSTFSFENALYDLSAIFRDISNVMRTAKSVFQSVDSDLQREADIERDIDRNHPIPSAYYFTRLSTIRDTKNEFLLSCDKLIFACENSRRKLVQFGNSKLKQDWDSFGKSSSIFKFRHLIHNTEEAASKITWELKKVADDVEQAKNLLKSYRAPLEAAFKKYFIPIFKNTVPKSDNRFMANGNEIVPIWNNIVRITNKTRAIDLDLMRKLKSHINRNSVKSVTEVSVLIDANRKILEKFIFYVSKFENSVTQTLTFLTNLNLRIAQAYDYIKRDIMIKHYTNSDAYKNLTTIIHRFAKLKADSRDFSHIAEKYEKECIEMKSGWFRFSSYIEQYKKSIHIGKQFLVDNYVYVNVFFRTLSLETLDKSEGYLWFSLVSDIGGSAGLYLGASILAIAEVFWFFGSQFVYSLKRMANNNVHASKDTKKTKNDESEMKESNDEILETYML
ncbi:uncharacterized protein LOC141899105 [Tubulanus polymorphus]|uniref:uncharacterized protein LOC141899105 n=1 Tax=Tubulanus polymorphus TaxID=672921 RepID=UPI003DA49DC7